MRIRTRNNRGIHLICDDGTVFSIQFGSGNYCENYNKDVETDQFDLKTKPDVESSDCEVAVIAPDGSWITNKIFTENGNHSDDATDVFGYCSIRRALQAALEHDSQSLRFIKGISECL
jgi:hypothetical protein